MKLHNMYRLEEWINIKKISWDATSSIKLDIS